MRCFQRLWLVCGVLAAGLSTSAKAATWFPLGPYGGDARSLAADPADSRHLFLGTATGWVYDSHDGGEHWNRVAQISRRNDLVIDHIIVDQGNPRRLIVGAYTVDHLSDGGIFISDDYGKDWYSQAQMRGQSVRSLSRSAGNPQDLVAGTLKGVFRSTDDGTHWQRISPEGSTEIKEVQSIAIAPDDPNVIYAGTWHLPWKTTDGGKTWSNIKQGIIDDSDVFSIIVDPKDPSTVYASACSGIYKSTDAGDLFHKVQGIPSAARRTRTLEQDPKNLNVVFAGTTEGLYRTEDAGEKWDRLTPADVIVNDVYVDPNHPEHVIMATDRGGVYRSEDGGASFEPSNEGFSARQVVSFAADTQRLNTIYVGVVNDKTTGGVFQSPDGGVSWRQQSEGLGGRDVFSLLSLPDGTLLAGTGHGIFRLAGDTWQDSSALEGGPVTPKPESPARSNVILAAPTRLVSPGPIRHLSSAAPASQQRKGVQRGAQKKARPAAKRPAPAVIHRHPSAYLRQFGRPHLTLAAWQTTSTRRSSHRAVTPGKKQTAARSLPVRKTAARGSRVPATRTSPPTVRRPEPVHAAVVAHTVAQESRPIAANASDRLDAVVYTLVSAGNTVFAGTASGLLQSLDNGSHWKPVADLAMPDVHIISALPPSAHAADPQGGAMVLVASLHRLSLSLDGGRSWDTVALPADLTQVGAASVDGDRNLWVGGREGVWLSTDYGANWTSLHNLFLTQVDSIFYDAPGKRVLVTASTSPNAFSVSLPDHKVSYVDTGWKLRFVRPVADHMVGATLFDGVVVQPRMVESPVTASSSPQPQRHLIPQPAAPTSSTGAPGAGPR